MTISFEFETLKTLAYYEHEKKNRFLYILYYKNFTYAYIF